MLILEHAAAVDVRRLHPARQLGPPGPVSRSLFPGGGRSARGTMRIAMEASPGYGSCGGMFTYNTMQSFIATCGMEPLHMRFSEDPAPDRGVPGPAAPTRCRRWPVGPPSWDIVTGAALQCDAGGHRDGRLTNVVLHGPELARAAGIDFWHEVISQQDFNKASATCRYWLSACRLAVTRWSHIDAKGGLPVIVRELLDAGARRRLHHLHRRDPGRAGRPAGPAPPGTAR